MIGVAYESTKKGSGEEVGEELGVESVVGVVDFDFAFSVEVDRAAVGFVGPLGGVVVNGLVAFGVQSVSRPGGVVVEAGFDGLLSLVDFGLDLLETGGLALHPGVGLDLFDGEPLLVVVLEHGGDQLEEVFGNERQVDVVGLGDRRPVLVVLLLLDELVQVVFRLGSLRRRHVSQHHHVQNDPSRKEVHAHPDVRVLLKHLGRHVSLSPHTRVHYPESIIRFYTGAKSKISNF